MAWTKQCPWSRSTQFLNQGQCPELGSDGFIRAFPTRIISLEYDITIYNQSTIGSHLTSLPSSARHEPKHIAVFTINSAALPSGPPPCLIPERCLCHRVGLRDTIQRSSSAVTGLPIGEGDFHGGISSQGKPMLQRRRRMDQHISCLPKHLAAADVRGDG